MAVAAKHKYAGISAQKARLVADMVRGLNVDKALEILNFSVKEAAHLIKKVLESAMANAEHNDGADIDELYVQKIYVDEAPVYKRFRARAKGRAAKILKRNCHITVVVDER